MARVVTSATLTAAKAEGAQAAAPAAEVESPAPADDAAVFIELAGVRVGVRRGFDAAVLRGVLDVLGGGR